MASTSVREPGRRGSDSVQLAAKSHSGAWCALLNGAGGLASHGSSTKSTNSTV